MNIWIDPERVYATDEYFEVELASDERHEYVRGHIVPRVSGTMNHAQIAMNVAVELSERLKDNACEAFGSTLRVKSVRSGEYVYPDALVTAGRAHCERFETTDSVTNPQVLVEVLSPTTEHADRVDKFRTYMEIETLREYVMIEQHKPRAEVYERTADGSGTLTIVADLDASVRLRSIDVELPMRSIYRGVRFPVWPALPRAEPSDDPAEPGAST